MTNRVQLFENFSCDPLFFYEAVVNSTDDYVFILDLQTDTALLSNNMYNDFELPGRIMQGIIPAWGALVHEKDRAGFFASMDNVINGIGNSHHIEYQVLNRRGEYVWGVCRAQLQRDEAGKPITFAGTITNVSIRGKVDHVTGLFTQAECERHISDMLERGKGAALLVLGLDNFTQINELRGHMFGDAVLRKFAQETQSLLPDGASIFRFDGDQFAIAFEGDETEGLLNIFKSVQAYCGAEHSIDGVKYFCSVSGGISAFEQDKLEYQDLIQYAAGALDDAKLSGKNCCRIFCPDSILPKRQSLEILEELRMSILDDFRGFEIAYQPFVSADTLELTGAEALLRWRCPNGQSISPIVFIPLLESDGLMVNVGQWVLKQALRQCKPWLEKNADFVLNVNVSFLQMQDPCFVSLVKDLLEETGFLSKNLVLELTESRFVTDKALLNDCFRVLRDAGIRIAMDDFGTGYSSLGMLYQCPADIVKIDRMFIDKINDAEHLFNFTFIQAVIKLCHSVGITVCVEGVEQQGELDAVRSLDADGIQGFYISRPLPPDVMEEKFFLDCAAD